MKTLKLIGFNVLFALYYLISYAIYGGIFAYGSNVNGIELFLGLVLICSPFIMVNLLMNKVSPPMNKRKFCTGWSIAIGVLLALYLLGVGTDGAHYDNAITIGIVVLSVSMVICLLKYKEQNTVIEA